MGIRRYDSHATRFRDAGSLTTQIYLSQVSEALASGVTDIRLTPGNMQLNDLEFYAASDFYPVEGKAAWSKCRRPVPRLAARPGWDTWLTARGLLHAYWRRTSTAQPPEASQGAAVSASQSRRSHRL